MHPFKLQLIAFSFLLACLTCLDCLGGPSPSQNVKGQTSAESTHHTPLERLSGKVTYVFDGDTVQLHDVNGISHKIRLNKIDAPEYDQPFGEEANQYLRSLVLKQEVSVDIVDVDTYGREVGILFVKAQEINLKMVQEGYAWHYAYHDQTPAYIAAEKAARKAKKGLWQNPNPINPYQWRKTHKK